MLLPLLSSGANDSRRRFREKVMVEEGLQLWRSKKQDEWNQKLRDQRELRHLLSTYSPWGLPGNGAPNVDTYRKRKLHLDGIFPDKPVTENGLVLGRPGCGAPLRTISGSTKTVYTCDPQLRFQFNEQTRKCVDNEIRYRKNPDEQAIYRQQLDALVFEKKQKNSEETRKATEFDKKLGWTDDKIIDELVQRQQKIRHEPKNINNSKESKELGGGIELVPLLARRRAAVGRFPLSTTDVTKNKLDNRMEDAIQIYIQDLSQQVNNRNTQIQDMKKQDNENSRRHFETWEGFWGRPGHGAPRNNKVRENLNHILYQFPLRCR